jgi:hypothetical protein
MIPSPFSQFSKLSLAVAALFPMMVAAEPKSATDILAVDPAMLAELLDDNSEVGEDRAARLWATAKRLETENKLAESSVSRVIRLAEWRDVLTGWQDILLEIRAFKAGGGTLWGHLASRDDADLEIFLASHANDLTNEPPDPIERKPQALGNPALIMIDKGAEFQKQYLGEDSTKQAAELKERFEKARSALEHQVALLPGGEIRKSVTNWAENLTKDSEE